VVQELLDSILSRLEMVATGRLDLNNPPTSVDGIRFDYVMPGVCRMYLKLPPTAVRGYSEVKCVGRKVQDKRTSRATIILCDRIQ
jgi:hypothetical protein